MRKSRDVDPSGHVPKPNTDYSTPASSPKGTDVVMPGETCPFEQTIDISDWKLFSLNVALWLAQFSNDTCLVLSAKRGWAYVQFAIQSFAVRAEAMSNNFIEPPEYKLSDEDEQTLVALGWNAPTKPNPELGDGLEYAGGSPNFWCDFISPVNSLSVATLAVDTLRRVYRIAQPSDLKSRTFQK